jgi:hypothetical protein
MRNTWLKSILLIALLAGCAPRSHEPPEPVVGIVKAEPEFFPNETGFSWTYLPEGSQKGSLAYTTTISGPGMLADATATRFVFRGRGQERVFYRNIDPQGSWLFGLEETISKTTITFNPPIKEYPSPAEIHVGAQWGGETQATTDNGKRRVSFPITYTFTVTGLKEVEVPAGRFDAFTIQFFANSPNQPPQQYEVWFVPKVGEVRTREGLLLTEWSFK